MVGVRIHGGFDLKGTDTEIRNLELEHLLNDPVLPEVGLIWYNVSLKKISYVEALDVSNNPIIRRVSSDTDITTLITQITQSSQATVVNNTTNNLLFGQPVYGAAGQSVELANAGDVNTKDVIGFVNDTILSNGGNGSLTLFGKMTGTEAQWGMIVNGGLIPNTRYFLDTVAGKLTSTIPTAAGAYACPVGSALSTTEFVVRIERPIAL